jgi:CD109 antigen
MITLVPNILALDYLLSINSSSSSSINNLESLIRDAKANIVDGYQRQLTYALDDGSFSAFGKSDQVGSTWLTAFVLKSFVAAKKYAPQIDEKVIRKAAEFLLKQQETSDGSFVEHGRVIHTDMQGGVESRPTITAYVTTSLFEAGGVIENVKNATSSAVSYLEGQVASLKDSFSLGLVTYALDLAQSSRFDENFDRFEGKSKSTEDGGKYWPVTLEADVENDVELTSYGLLMSLRHKNVSDVVSIVRYLISKISGSGGFSGTQNTVLGLRALTEFALKTISKSKKDREVYVDVTIDGDSTNLKTFAVKGK